MNILFLSRWFPFPSDNGSRQRIAALLAALAERHRVSLLSFVENSGVRAYAEADHAHLDEVHTVSFPRAAPLHPLDALRTPGPRSLAAQHSWLMHDRVTELTTDRHFDLLVTSEIDMLPYAAVASVPRCISDDVEIGVYHDALRNHWLHGGLRARIRWTRLTSYLRRVLHRFALCTTVSDRERELITHSVSPACPTRVVPNGVDAQACSQVRAAPQPKTLIYAGALTYRANFDAVAYFISEVLPHVRAEIPDVTLRVTGDAPPGLVAQLPHDAAVEFTGYLDDVRTAVARSWVSVVPLRSGSGTRLKILEAMALGVPVVATPKGAEGLQHDGAVLVAEDANAFARGVIDLLRDPALRDVVGARARRVVAERYDWKTIGASFVADIEEAVGRA
jgi:glycosyltransferase involved in cell wall biosynthesis